MTIRSSGHVCFSKCISGGHNASGVEVLLHYSEGLYESSWCITAFQTRRLSAAVRGWQRKWGWGFNQSHESPLLPSPPSRLLLCLQPSNLPPGYCLPPCYSTSHCPCSRLLSVPSLQATHHFLLILQPSNFPPAFCLITFSFWYTRHMYDILQCIGNKLLFSNPPAIMRLKLDWMFWAVFCRCTEAGETDCRQQQAATVAQTDLGIWWFTTPRRSYSWWDHQGARCSQVLVQAVQAVCKQSVQ